MNALTLPDIAAQEAKEMLPLDWVGMGGIATPILLDGNRLSCTADIGVSLDDGAARGIHMSRLYLALQRLENTQLSPSAIKDVLQECLDSHIGLTERATLRLHTALLLERPALVSQLTGWRSYPFSVYAQLDGKGLHLEISLTLEYSSTCPCSAALARQLIQRKFQQDFANEIPTKERVEAWLGSAEGILATPHSQRSSAQLQAQVPVTASSLPHLELINLGEAALSTPVQTAVKRADEQAFALANGQNLMFCEDAARRLHRALAKNPVIDGFHIRVVHAESLHAHDAVAEASSNWRLQ